ncbi:MAG: glycosyltransferase family 4 protein [Alphaproteobacteria bacterium]|nr:glycosyltransferase family 4 protein [Alphaproteobacteria bacterium]MBT5389764.1 glycosyltransferase family 4 protein [Alphaproteobacteria bacterium]MBT5540858.1 glycosyltransferase family 4 protein [Alphaproteobacteria bacterium]
MKMCSAFSRLKHKVTLECLPGTILAKDAFSYYDVTPDFSVSCNDEKSYWLSGFLWHLKEKLPGVRVGPIPSILYGYGRIRNKVRRLSPDLIYSRNQYWLRACLKLRIPMVFESHHPPRNKLDYLLQKKIIKSAYFQKLVVISEKLKAIYLREFSELSQEIVLVCHDGADPVSEDSFGQKCERKGVQVGYVGQIYNGRGIDVILQVAQKLRDISFQIIGGEKEEIERQKNLFEVPSNVKFYGHLPHSKLKSIYPNIDIALAPYQHQVSTYGGKGNTVDFMSPLKLFEYMSWKKTIICSDLPVLREVLSHDESAIFVRPDDIEGWVAAISKLVTDPKIGKTLSEKAFSSFKEKYTWDARAKRVLTAI